MCCKEGKAKMKDWLSCPEYEALKENYMAGWKTWNVNSVLSYVHMPDALALNLCVKEYSCGNFLREALIGRFPSDDPEDATEVLFPGDHAADDSYTAMTVRWCGLEFLVESAAEENMFALLVTPVKEQLTPPLLCLQGGYMWNRPGFVRLCGDSLWAEGENGEKWIVCMSAASSESDRNVPLTGPFLAASLTGRTGFYAQRVSCRGEGDDTEASEEETAQLFRNESKEALLEKVCALVHRKRTRLDARYESFGPLSWMARAMECAIAWDSVYDASHDRVISPVSRLWSIRKGGYVLFCWDNFFAGFMAGFCSKALAYSNVTEILNERTEKGFVPNMSCGNGQKTLDRSQPPVGSRMVLELYGKFHDSWLIRMLYPALFEWNTWFYENRRALSGAMCWGSDPAPVIYGNRWETDGGHDRFGGALESGLDNSPMYDDIPFDPENSCLVLEDVGLTGLFLMDCSALITLAGLLGEDKDAAVLEERRKVVSAGLEGLWDEENGFYYNRRTDTKEFSRRISPTNFYALFAEDIPAERLPRILNEHYYNTDEFYGEWMLPSIARNDAAYTDQDYWRGRVWAPLNFLVYLAFEQQGLKEACADLARKSVAIFRPEWEQHRHVHENYNSITGEGCDAHNSDKFYHWGALLSAIALRESNYR